MKNFNQFIFESKRTREKGSFRNNQKRINFYTDMLYIAIKRNDLQNVITAVENGADINRQGSNNITPFLEACYQLRNEDYDEEIIKYLIENGADYEQKEKNSGVNGLKFISNYIDYRRRVDDYNDIKLKNLFSEIIEMIVDKNPTRSYLILKYTKNINEDTLKKLESKYKEFIVSQRDFELFFDE